MLELDSSGDVVQANGWAAEGLRELFNANSDNHYYEYTYDPEGNVSQRQSQNNSTSYSLNTSVYDAYGKLLHKGGTSPGNESEAIGFAAASGGYTDNDQINSSYTTGLVEMGHRYYDPLVGRFVNRDPIDYNGGINLYSYAGNNPITGNDPSGLDVYLCLFDGYVKGVHTGNHSFIAVNRPNKRWPSVFDFVPGTSSNPLSAPGIVRWGHSFDFKGPNNTTQMENNVAHDPIDYNGGINLYSYAENNPITGRDPSGLDALILEGRNKTNQPWLDSQAKALALYYDIHTEQTAHIVRVDTVAQFRAAIKAANYRIDHLEFVGHGGFANVLFLSEGRAGTLHKEDVATLDATHVEKNAVIDLSACHTAQGTDSMALTFAKHYNTKVWGVDGDLSYGISFPPHQDRLNSHPWFTWWPHWMRGDGQLVSPDGTKVKEDRDYGE